MAFQHGESLSFSSRFISDVNKTGRINFSNSVADPADEWEFNQYCTASIPAAGSNVSASDSFVNSEGPIFLSHFVAPAKLRLEKIAWTLEFKNPHDTTTHIRIGAIKCVFASQGTVYSDPATWTCLGYANTSTLTDVTGTVHKGTASFTSSDGDVDKYEGVGIGIESYGTSSSISQAVDLIYGTITVVLRVIG